MPTTFVISDHHFNHANIIKYCSRPYDTVEWMNEDMIVRWNSVVRDEDVVYHVGDFAFGSLDQRREIFNKLKGEKHLILGNHDESHSKALAVGWWTALPSKKVEVLGKLVLLQHRPAQVFPPGVLINVHGHIHDRPAISDYHINVGVEQVEYTPQILQTLILDRLNALGV